MAVMSTCFGVDPRILTAGIFLILLLVVRAPEKFHSRRATVNGAQARLGAPDVARRSWANLSIERNLNPRAGAGHRRDGGRYGGWRPATAPAARLSGHCLAIRFRQ
jgi:hypothetical protein